MFKYMTWRWHSWRTKRATAALFAHTNILVDMKKDSEGHVTRIVLTKEET